MSNETFQTIVTEVSRGVLYIQFARQEANNSINQQLLKELQKALQAAELDPTIKVILLKGTPTYFCTGMDFEQVNNEHTQLNNHNPEIYFEILQNLSTCSKTVISIVEGLANAGGIGFVAVSDIVLAKPTARFGLSEALFGLLPACVLPFLIRRIGFQKAQWMTLTTQSINAKRAFEIGLVDELSEDIQDTLRKQLLRLTKLETSTIKELKQYTQELWIINEQTKKLAVSKITNLLASDQVKTNINHYIKTGEFPWNRK